MAIDSLEPDQKLRDLPCLIVAIMLHGALLSAPAVRWRPAQAAEPAVAVEFVTELPAPPPELPVSPALEPVPSAQRPAAAVKKAPAQMKKATSAKRRAVHEKRRAALAAVAAARRERLEAEKTTVAWARRRAEASQSLAALAEPDEKLSDAVADTAAKTAAPASLAAPAAAPRDAQEPVYDLGRDGTSAARFGETGLSWSLDGPAGSRKLLRKALPASPDWLTERGLEPSVQVKFQVLPDGSVKPGAVVKKTSGFPEIDRRALEALALWRFAATKGAAPETWGVVTFRFLMN